MMIAGIYFTVKDWKILAASWRSRNWQSTQGKIIEVTNESFEIPGTAGYIPTTSVKYLHEGFVYKYKVNGKKYHSQSVCFGGHAEGKLTQLMTGSNVTVFYDPQNPKDSVLKKGLTAGSTSGIMFATLGALLTLWMGIVMLKT